MVNGTARRTSLLWLDPTAATIQKITALPSGGDTSYPGLGYRQGAVNLSSFPG